MAEASADAQNAARFPAWSWALEIPELKALFSDPNITNQDQFAAAIEGTDWWKQNAPAVRNWQARTATDPAGAEQDKRQKEADVWDLYNNIGMTPDAKTVQDTALAALQFQWTPAQLKDSIVKTMTYSGPMTGQIGAVQSAADSFKQTAAKYMVSIDDQTAFNWGKSVADGEHSVDDYNVTLQQQAMNRFSYSPEIQGAIQRGTTPQDYFAPYAQEASKLLETTADSIDFMNSPRWNQVIDHVDQQGVRRAMTIPEMQTYVRGFNEYGNTQQAKDQAASLGATILKTFGAVG